MTRHACTAAAVSARPMPLIRLTGGAMAMAVAALVAIPALAIPALAEPAPRSVPHRAHYAMTLADATGDSGIAAVTGDMTVIFDRMCKGWSVLQASRMEIDFVEGEPVVSDILFDAEEDDDGRHFRFRYEERENGDTIELAIANLDRAAVDKPARLRFANPPGLTETVPAGALLPTAHTEKLLAAAAAGQPFVRDMVLTGSGTDSLSYVSAHIGKARPIAGDLDWPEGAASDADIGALRSETVYPMRLAFFDAGDTAETPVYELIYQMQPNGIVRRFDIDYGGFSISARLTSIESRAETGACK
ncbi:DUF1849 family protein [Tistrella bauzanensis]|uniref:DUF1849 family protein n=1 Tax=Tistrella arctica TaxID=3133430 RepID=A0ABU9YMH7_9PROT